MWANDEISIRIYFININFSNMALKSIETSSQLNLISLQK